MGRRLDPAEEQLEAAFTVLFASHAAPMWLYDEQTLRFLAVNDAAVAFYGYSREEFLARTVLDIRPAEDVPAVLTDVEDRGHVRREGTGRRHTRKDGTLVEVEVTSQTVGVGARHAILVTVQEATDPTVSTGQVERQARHDLLTGLEHRSFFVERLRAALEVPPASRPLTAVVALDVDHLRHLNLRLGHSATDRILAAVARRLREAVASDPRCGAVARLGADEFGCLLEGVPGGADLHGMVEALAAALEGPIPVGGELVALTVCAGVAEIDGGVADADAVLAEVEAALHRAKSRGPGQRDFSTVSVRSDLQREAALEDALAGAADRGELLLEYQPKVSLVDERIVGVEALLRWDRPGHGRLFPGEFLPIAERSGLIVGVGAWVIEQACRDAARWQGAFSHRPTLAVSINVSPRQFEADLRAVLERATALAGISPDTLCLELTESMVMADVDAAATTLRALKTLGVRVSIDDFGTGYSSLAYLKRLPLDELKIDRSFVEGLGREDESTAIVAAITATAQAVGLSVVAEGVERAEQVSHLRRLGCDQLQGYYLGAPAPAERIDELLTDDAAVVATLRARRGREGMPAETVLVVDDARTVRELVRLTLDAAGFAVHEADTGVGAMLAADAIRPDCVILDVNLPDLSGHEVCRLFRQNRAFRDVAIIMLTVESGSPEKAAAFARDADDYVVKPFTPRDLVDRVRVAMRRRRGAVHLEASR